RGAVTFDNAFAPSCWTVPSHGSLFTGELPRVHELRLARGDLLRADLPTLAETLKRVGYETVAVTANLYLSPLTGLDRGFDRLVPVGGDIGKGAGEDVLREVDAWLADRAIVDRSDRKPYFLFVNLMDAHPPMRPDAEDLEALGDPEPSKEVARRAMAYERQRSFRLTLGLDVLDEEARGALDRLYDAGVHKADRVTGDLLQRLQAAEGMDDTVVAITSDHGELLGEGAVWGHFLSLHDAVLHVPLVVRWPGHLDDGRRESASVRLLDLHPTLLRAAGVPPPQRGADGARSLDAAPLEPRRVFASFARPTPYLREMQRMAPGAPRERYSRHDVAIDALREPADGGGALKYVRYSRRDTAGGPATLLWERLHDLSEDPGENRDLLSGEASDLWSDRAARLRLSLDADHR
ncbi:MAG: sulfatase, partial [Planctomycetota bacterium]